MDQERQISAHAEEAVKRHFEGLGAKLEAEPSFEAKHPDFGALVEDQIVAVIEVKSLTTPPFTKC